MLPASPVRTISVESANDRSSGTPTGRSIQTKTPCGRPNPLIEIGSSSISRPERHEEQVVAERHGQAETQPEQVRLHDSQDLNGDDQRKTATSVRPRPR